MAPEYFMHGITHEKTDVFAFGVILLELITGRHAVNSDRQSLVKWVCYESLIMETFDHLLISFSMLFLSTSKLTKLQMWPTTFLARF